MRTRPREDLDDFLTPEEWAERDRDQGATPIGDPIGPPPVLEALDVGDDDKPIPPRQWLLGVAFCREFLSGLIAPGAGGKTALRIAAGALARVQAVLSPARTSLCAARCSSSASRTE